MVAFSIPQIHGVERPCDPRTCSDVVAAGVIGRPSISPSAPMSRPDRPREAGGEGSRNDDGASRRPSIYRYRQSQVYRSDGPSLSGDRPTTAARRRWPRPTDAPCRASRTGTMTPTLKVRSAPPTALTPSSRLMRRPLGEIGPLRYRHTDMAPSRGLDVSGRIRRALRLKVTLNPPGRLAEAVRRLATALRATPARKD